MERTFVMVKPDGVDRGLIGEVISRIESKNLKIAAMKLMKISEETARRHYNEHVGKPFFPALMRFITMGPVVAMIIEGPDVIEIMRKLAGATNPKEALPGTIRKEFAMYVTYNILHCSDSADSANREISIFFNEDEIVSYSKSLEKWNELLK